jgi:hypothetical protein
MPYYDQKGLEQVQERSLIILCPRCQPRLSALSEFFGGAKLLIYKILSGLSDRYMSAFALYEDARAMPKNV